ncbi:MAG: hypothetical protein GXP54_04695 [Deltaproteobacteria bacterium]|nr:hypothetical protein [Deltaproteobacteria bacterium]
MKGFIRSVLVSAITLGAWTGCGSDGGTSGTDAVDNGTDSSQHDDVMPDTPFKDVSIDIQIQDQGQDVTTDVSTDIPKKDAPQNDTSTDVMADIPGKDVTGDTTLPDVPGGTVTIRGVAWRYYCMFCDAPDATSGLYYMEPAGGVEVTTVGLAEEVQTKSSDDQCDTWWMPDSTAECGQFELTVPAGASIFLRAAGDKNPDYPEAGYLNGLGPVFIADENSFQVLVLTQKKLVDLMQQAWGVKPDPKKGVVAGITAVLAPEADTLYTEFIGGATVSLTPLVTDEDYTFVYFDSQDMKNTDRKDTAPAQPLFFASNVPPRDISAPYTATATHPTSTFEPMDFPVEAGAMTYLPMSPTE